MLNVFGEAQIVAEDMGTQECWDIFAKGTDG